MHFLQNAYFTHFSHKIYVFFLHTIRHIHIFAYNIHPVNSSTLSAIVFIKYAHFIRRKIVVK